MLVPDLSALLICSSPMRLSLMLAVSSFLSPLPTVEEEAPRPLCCSHTERPGQARSQVGLWACYFCHWHVHHGHMCTRSPWLKPQAYAFMSGFTQGIPTPNLSCAKGQWLSLWGLMRCQHHLDSIHDELGLEFEKALASSPAS